MPDDETDAAWIPRSLRTTLPHEHRMGQPFVGWVSEVTGAAPLGALRRSGVAGSPVLNRLGHYWTTG
jgi:hypothetical protein